MKNCKEHHAPENVDPNWKVGIVFSTYYEDEINSLVECAKETLIDAGVTSSSIYLHPVAGSFEVPLIGAALANAGEVDALIGFGIIIQGETEHADHIARETARGIMDVQTRYRTPFAYEVLHVNSLKEVQERCSGNENKGKEAACTVLHSLAELQSMRS